MARIPKKSERSTKFTLEWSEPPKPVRKGVWVERLAPLTERPGESAKVAEGKRSNIQGIAGNLRNGTVAVPDGEWEFTVRTLDGDVAGLWARYVGEDGGEGEVGDGDAGDDGA